MINWGDVATWVAGIGTVATFIVGFWQIRNERNIRRQQEAENKKQEIRNQAENISAWVAKDGPAGAWLAVLNQSKYSIYEVIVSIVAFQGAGGRDAKTTPSGFRSFLSTVPPGKYYTSISANYHGMSFHPSVEVAFKDNKGRYWVRSGIGEVTQIDVSPVEYYNLPLPLPWRLPEQETPENIKG